MKFAYLHTRYYEMVKIYQTRFWSYILSINSSLVHMLKRRINKNLTKMLKTGYIQRSLTNNSRHDCHNVNISIIYKFLHVYNMFHIFKTNFHW